MLGMSQEKLGDAIGLTFQQVQKYEKGRNRVGASRLQQIADALQTQPAWFFEGAPGHPRPKHGSDAHKVDEDLAAFLADRLAPRLVRAFVKLPTGVKRSVVNLLAVTAGEPEEA